jgi:hypothetical protein
MSLHASFDALPMIARLCARCWVHTSSVGCSSEAALQAEMKIRFLGAPFKGSKLLITKALQKPAMSCDIQKTLLFWLACNLKI